MARPEVRRLAAAVHGAAHLAVQRHGRQHLEAIVDALEPLELDPAGLEMDPLTDEDVTFGKALTRHLETEPLAIGDTLVLIETERGDYIAVDVLPAAED